jgi:threonine dehydratase
MLDLALIQAAAAALEGRVRHTPVDESPALSEALGVSTCLKLECLQLTGSFKLRGALFALARLDPRARARGVMACSAGNHGKALAWAGREAGVPVRVVVPRTADESKVRGMRGYGAEVQVADTNSYDEAEALARDEAQRLGLPFVSAFEDEGVMAGNGGSLALEILADVPDVANVLLPVGGGGMGAGMSVAFETLKPDVRLVACQHRDSAAFALSLERGVAVTHLPGVETLAGGLEGGMGAANFELMRHRVREAVLCSEDEILRAVVWVLREHHLLVEPSAAVTVAACLSDRRPFLEGRTVVVLSGRNLGVANLRRILDRDLL